MNTQTQKPTQTAAPEQAPAAQLPATQGQGKAVARLAPARLPYHPAIEQAFGVDRTQWRALTDSLYPLAKTTEAVVLALSYCKARHLDIMKKPVHIVPMWNAELNREVETVWPAITEHRITAHRTGAYAGTSETRFGPFETKHFEAKIKKGKRAGQLVSADVTFPQWAEVTCYRFVQGQKVEFPGPRVYFMEFFGMNMGLPVPNARWARSPSQMLEKCAEAGALRKAFTEEIGSDPVAEEMEGRIIEQVIEAMNKARPEAGNRLRENVITPQNEVIDESDEPAAPAAAAVEEGEEEDGDDRGEPIQHEEEERVTPAAEQRQEPAKGDRGADWLANRIGELPKIKDRAVLSQKDASVREVLANEKREADLLPKWEEAFKAALAALPAEAAKAQPAKLSPEDQAYEDWKAEQYTLLTKAKITRTVDDLQDMVVKDLRPADQQAFVDACNEKAKELFAAKSKT